jgi:hypothetical protein
MRSGESARTLWGERVRKRARRISRPVYSKCTREHTGLEEKALRARWGAHRERVEQTRRQRFGVARRSANTHGIARCIPVFWVWGGR